LKPNILHIIDSFEQGGTERQALQLVRMLQAHGGYGVHLACLQKKGTLLSEAEKLGLGEIAEYPLTSFYDLNFVRQVRRLARFLKQSEISLIHTHDFYTNVFGMTAGTIARVPARIASKRETDGFRTSAQKRIERGAYRFAHKVIANSNAVRDQLIREGALAERIVTLHNGLDMTRFTPSAGISRQVTLKSFGLPQDPDRRFVVIVANVNHPVKDHETFLRAAARVHSEVPASTFVVAGEGKLMSSLQEFAAQLSLARDVFFLGRCERIPELLSISDVCVLSSRAEGFSNSILEYMAAARPVVVTDVGGAREAVVEGETGYIVSASDDEGMADRIAQLLRDPKRARAMGERGRIVVTEKFSCAAQLAGIEQLYEGVERLRSATGLENGKRYSAYRGAGRDVCPSAEGPREQSERLEGVRE
jgi:glycosyltransferase involved in cell wall biosynthesis